MLLKKLIPQRFKNYFWHWPKSVWAIFRFQNPSQKMKLIGVTGTDGKTTTCYLIHYFLSKAGLKAGLVTSVAAKIGQEEVSTGFHITSPSPYKLQDFLAKMVKVKNEYAVLETTSHGWDQFRHWGCRFEVGVLTNVTHEHLDYHQAFSRYLDSKLKLLKASKNLVLNAEDKTFSKIKKEVKKPYFSFGFKRGADLTACRLKQKNGQTSFILNVKKGKFLGNYPIVSPLLGEFNVANVLAAFGAGLSLGLSPARMIKALKTFPGVAGRMELIPNHRKIKAYVDFAHTPNGLKSALEALRKVMPKSKKLIVVLGAAGLRDVEKRPLMGEIAASLADYAIFTSEDPRTEDQFKIAQEIAGGAKKRGWKRLSKRKVKIGRLKSEKGFFIETNRQEAINLAVRKLANSGDYVIACGKGHEQSMCFGKTEYPWSEYEAIKVALKGRRKR